MTGIRLAGVHVKAGALNVAVVELTAPDVFHLVARTRLSPNDALPDAPRLADLAERFRQNLSPHGVVSIGILQTRSFSNWRYVDAYARVFAIAAVLQASTLLSVPVETHSTNKVGRSVALPPTRLKDLAASLVGESSIPTYWTTGLADASAVAIHALKGVVAT